MLLRKLLILSCFSFCYVSCLSSADKIDFYLPQDFTGSVVIMYSCKNGIEPALKNESKQIVVPKTGIVRLKQPIKFGQIQYKYFYQSKNVQELKVHRSFEKVIQDSFYVGPGTVVTEVEFDSVQKKKAEQSAFIFYVHKKGEIFTKDYNDSWINDTLKSQIKINRGF